MMDTGLDSVFPDYPGLEPRWERRYHGRFHFEIEALRRVGITPEPDPDALRAGRLAITFNWRLDAETTLRLRAVYPDTFPHFRPEVFLISGLEPRPVRHINPIGGNFCLLGRDSRQWMPSWTLCKLLQEQLKDAIRESGNEDPQGEPADVWWNTLGPPGAYCLIDSTWDLKDTREGLLHLRYVQEKSVTDASGGNIHVPIVRAVVTEIRDHNNKLIHKWNGPIPFDVAGSNRTLSMPWVRLDHQLLPEPEFGRQVEDVYQSHLHLQRSRPHPLGSKLSVVFFAIAHPTEIAFGQTGTGWVFFQVFGHPKAFKNQRQKRNRNKQQERQICTLPVYRAGPDDMGHRVPHIKLLREKRVLVVGLGALGAPVAIELARNGCRALHLIDHDIIEPGNTVRWPLGASVWGRRKVDGLKGFLEREYSITEVHIYPFCLGGIGGGAGDDEVLEKALSQVELVIDAAASYSVTTLLAERCRDADLPLISLFATPTVEGGVVVQYSGEGGCPICLEHAWDQNKIAPPSGRSGEDDLTQPPGCAERTFVGADYDLHELSLQAVRLAIEILSGAKTRDSLVQTLSFVDEDNQRCPPRWRVDALPKHPDCKCQSYVATPRK